MTRESLPNTNRPVPTSSATNDFHEDRSLAFIRLCNPFQKGTALHLWFYGDCFHFPLSFLVG